MASWFERQIDRITRLPGQVSERADNVNDKFIDLAKDIQAATAGAGRLAEENLTQNKIGSLGRNASRWISENLVISGAVAALIIILILKK